MAAEFRFTWHGSPTMAPTVLVSQLDERGRPTSAELAPVELDTYRALGWTVEEVTTGAVHLLAGFFDVTPVCGDESGERDCVLDAVYATCPTCLAILEESTQNV
jgi:hypothetical protein